MTLKKRKCSSTVAHLPVAVGEHFALREIRFIKEEKFNGQYK